MKTIEIDEALYQYIASQTQYIGESASSILRRLIACDIDGTSEAEVKNQPAQQTHTATNNSVTSKTDPKVVNQPSSQQAEPSSKAVEIAQDSVFDYINKEELAMQRGAVGRFLLILAALYRVHSSLFANVCDIRGRDRLYFANNEEALAESGSSTKPRQIPDSPYWVITNSNTTRKKMMLTEVAISLGYSADEAEKIRDLL